MDRLRIVRYWRNHLIDFQRPEIARGLIVGLILSVFVTSCETEPYGTNWENEDTLTISQYLEKNKDDYSKFYKLLVEGKMFATLYAYNPYGEDYTLFLPTDEAIDNFILQNQNYESFEELLLDTGFINVFTRYHTLNRKVHTDEFPDGALNDRTITGDRLVAGFYTDGDNQIVTLNGTAQIIKSNLKMNNGFIHVISSVLEKVEISGYDWLQQQEDYTILAQAMQLSGIRKGLWWKNYTILAEHDSIYRRKGINNIQDLINQFATPGVSLSNKENSFYKFAGYHLVGGELYLNDLFWGQREYTTFGAPPLTIDVGLEIKFNPGVDKYGIKISDSGDTTLIDYIRPVLKHYNIITNTGPVHSISDVLYFNPF